MSDFDIDAIAKMVIAAISKMGDPEAEASPATPAKASRKAAKAAATIPCLSLTHFNERFAQCVCYGTDAMPVVNGRVQTRVPKRAADGTVTIPDTYVPLNFAWVATRDMRFWHKNASSYLRGRGFEITPDMRETAKTHPAFAGVNALVTGYLEKAGLTWDAIGGDKLPIGPTKLAVMANRAAIRNPNR